MPFQKGNTLGVGNKYSLGRVPWNKDLKVDREKYPKMGAFGKRSKEQRKRISDGHKGQKSWNKGKKFLQVEGENNSEWKGDDVGYRALHHWVKRHFGVADKCRVCGKLQTESGKMIHWSNISGKYKRQKDDWQKLCAKCHKNYDLNILQGGQNNAFEICCSC